ncbi:MAG: HD-GYP domain-containing protein [Lachnospiraceae bacterium]|nr:HD-GYP domain-containing protein [Lachnospiraceae bacterium]
MVVSIDVIKEGMVLKEDVINEKGMLIVAKDTIVTENILSRLRLYKITEVDITKNRVKREGSSLKDSIEFKHFKKETNEVKDSLNNSFNKILNDVTDNVELNHIMDMGKRMFADNCGNSNILDMLYCMQEFSDTTYVHCINVAMIAGLLGKWLSWSEDDINMLVICGMFHDIGKLTIPDAILHKPGKLTDSEYFIMKQHTVAGFNRLQHIDILPPEVKRTAMLHHERCNGTGYPLGIVGEKIDKYSKVIAIADVYDALTANRVYRDALCPFDVVAILEKEGLELYETRYIMTFLHKVLYSYLNKKVYLNNGMVASIKEINPDSRAKPVVMFEGGRIVDLSQYDGIKIDSVIE